MRRRYYVVYFMGKWRCFSVGTHLVKTPYYDTTKFVRMLSRFTSITYILFVNLIITNMIKFAKRNDMKENLYHVYYRERIEKVYIEKSFLFYLIKSHQS